MLEATLAEVGGGAVEDRMGAVLDDLGTDLVSREDLWKMKHNFRIQERA